MKYIVATNDQGEKTILVFPNHVPHVRMGGDTLRTMQHFGNTAYEIPHIGKATSAGFIGYKEGGVPFCHGRSESLGLKSEEGDTELLLAEMSMSEYDRSIKIKKK